MAAAEAVEAVASIVVGAITIRYLPCSGVLLWALPLVVALTVASAIPVSVAGAALVVAADSTAVVLVDLGRKVLTNLLTGPYVQYFRALA